jgi:hypothetical protein
MVVTAHKDTVEDISFGKSVAKIQQSVLTSEVASVNILEINILSRK